MVTAASGFGLKFYNQYISLVEIPINCVNSESAGIAACIRVGNKEASDVRVFVSNVPSHGGLNALPNFVCVVHFMLSGNIFLSSLGLIRLLLAEFVARLYSKVCVKDLLPP